jgi:hypothetical protein
MTKFSFWRFSIRKNALKRLNRMLNELDSCHGARVSRSSSDNKLWVEIGRDKQQTLTYNKYKINKDTKEVSYLTHFRIIFTDIQ